MPIQILPFKGADSTAQLVIQVATKAQLVATPRILAESICKDIRQKDYLSEYIAILRFVEANTRYTRDPSTVEQVKDPLLVIDEINNGKRPLVDCDDQVALLLSLLISVGAQCRVTICSFEHLFYKNKRQYTHIFISALDPLTQQYVVLDPVANIKTKEMLKRIVACKMWEV